MRAIKRYANRKLYDTVTKRYLTLDALGDLVRKGEDVKVVDNDSGRDITNVTLSLAILGRERDRSAFLSRGLLTGLLSRGRNSVYDVVKRSLTAWLDGIHGTAEDVERFVTRMVKDRQITREEGRRLGRHIARVLRKNRRATEAWIMERAQESVARIGLPVRADVDRVRERADRISARLDAMLARGKGAGPAEKGGRRRPRRG